MFFFTWIQIAKKTLIRILKKRIRIRNTALECKQPTVSVCDAALIVKKRELVHPYANIRQIMRSCYGRYLDTYPFDAVRYDTVFNFEAFGICRVGTIPIF